MIVSLKQVLPALEEETRNSNDDSQILSYLLVSQRSILKQVFLKDLEFFNPFKVIELM